MTTNQERNQPSKNVRIITKLSPENTNRGYWNSGQKWRPQQTERKCRDHNKHNAERKYRYHKETDTREEHLIEATEIQTGGNSKPRSLSFISFSLLIRKFSYFKWLFSMFLIKVDVVVDEKKKSRKWNIYYERTPITGTATASSGYLNSSICHHCYVKSFWVTRNYDCNKKTYCCWWKTWKTQFEYVTLAKLQQRAIGTAKQAT